jgi:hypothetical protein
VPDGLGDRVHGARRADGLAVFGPRGSTPTASAADESASAAGTASLSDTTSVSVKVRTQPDPRIVRREVPKKKSPGV